MYNQFLRAAVQYTGLDTAVHRVNNKICKNCQLRNNRGETTRSTFLCVSNSICSSFVSCFRGASVCVVLYYYLLWWTSSGACSGRALKFFTYHLRNSWCCRLWRQWQCCRLTWWSSSVWCTTTSAPPTPWRRSRWHSGDARPRNNGSKYFYSKCKNIMCHL